MKHIRAVMAILLFLVALVAMTGCQEPENEIPGSATITVRVADSMDAKTITPEGNVDVSHYVITVVNEAEGISQGSGYLVKGSSFSISNVPAGVWYAKVDAYIQRDTDTYVKVASDQSEPKTVQAGESATFDLVLDVLDAVVSGDVTVTLKMPTELSTQSTAFWYQYAITGMTDEEFIHTSELLSGSTGADGLATITLDADAIGLMQGAYRFSITVQDAETSPTVTRKGVDVMRLVNGLEAKGTIDLTSYEADQSFDVTITDRIGDILVPEIVDGQESYILADGEDSLSVILATPLTATQTIEWYVDGELDETVNTDEAASGKYTLIFAEGNHIITAIIRDVDTLMAVGSIDAFGVQVAVGFVEQFFTFRQSYNSTIGDYYVVTGLVASEGELIMPESGVLEIPATYKGMPVMAIDDLAFRNRTDIVGSVIIPEGVTSIRNNAFRNCSNLDNIDLPESLVIIEKAAFRGCTSLSEVSLPSGLQTLEGSDLSASQDSSNDGGVFEDCTSLTSINIPDSITIIGARTFRDCTALEGIEIHEGVTSIEHSAFRGCSSLADVSIPGSVTSIGACAFERCFALTDPSVLLREGLVSLDNGAFRYCNGLAGDLILPSSLEQLGGFNGYDDNGLSYGVFAGCSGLDGTLDMSKTKIKVIGDCSFENTSIKNVIFPDGLESIGQDAFKGAALEGTLEIPASVKGIGSSAFYWMESDDLELVLHEGLEYIGASAFHSTDFAGDLIIPDSVRFIGASAFRYSYFRGTLDLGSGVETIGGAAFYRVQARNEVLVIPNSVTTLKGYGVYGDSTFGDNDFKSIEFEDGSPITTIPTGLYDDSYLIRIRIPDGITTMEAGSVRNVSSSVLIFIPDTVSVMQTSEEYPETIRRGTVYCESQSIPAGWASEWAGEEVDAFWGVPEDEYEAIMNNNSVSYEVPEPVISVNGDVTITCDKSFAHIYYTIDGSEPTKDNGTLYEEPFAVSDGITVKAVAYVGNGIYSAVAKSSGV